MKLLTCSVTMSAVALTYMAIDPLLARRYSAKGRYYGWLIIVIGLLIPFRPTFRGVAMRVSVPVDAYAPLVNRAAQATVPGVSLWQVLFGVWLVGMIGFVVYHTARHIRFVRMVGRWSEAETDTQTLSVMSGLKTEMGIGRRIALMRCPCVNSPMLIGIAKPKILLPDQNFDEGELRFIIRHELTHYARCDLLFKCAALLMAAMHWFNPVIYRAARAIDALCEMSCDADVIRGADVDARLRYSETIIGVVRRQSQLNTALSTNFYGGMKGMKNRIFAIMDGGKKKAGFFVITCALLIAVIGAGFAFATDVDAPDAGNDNYTYEEFAEVVAGYRRDMQMLADHNEPDWPQGRVDEANRMYEDMLEEVRTGKIILAKPVLLSDTDAISSAYTVPEGPIQVQTTDAVAGEWEASVDAKVGLGYAAAATDAAGAVVDLGIFGTEQEAKDAVAAYLKQ